MLRYKVKGNKISILSPSLSLLLLGVAYSLPPALWYRDVTGVDKSRRKILRMRLNMAVLCDSVSQHHLAAWLHSQSWRAFHDSIHHSINRKLD